jgi:hypothetical protein
MRNRCIHLAGGSLIALALLGTATPALAKARRHGPAHHDGEAAEIAALKAQVNALTARLDALTEAQHATADQAAAASLAAQTAQTQSAAAQSQSAQVSAQVASNDAAVSKRIASEVAAKATSNTRIYGQAFVDASNIDEKTYNAAGVATKVKPSGTGLDIKRFYLGVDQRLSKTFSAVFLIDAQASSAPYTGNANLSGANVYIKNAYLQAKLSDALIVRVGAASMPWIPFAESVYGQRYIENTLVDRIKAGNTTDWGVHVLGTLGDPKGFNIGYAASVVNGGGYKNPTRSDSVDFEGRLSANYHGFTAGIGGYTGKLAADAQGTTTLHTATRLDALVGYVGPRLRVGAEWYRAKNYSQYNVLNPLVDVSEGYTLYGTVYVIPKWSVFGRYDHVKPNKDTANLRTDNYFNVGITYSPLSNVDLSLVYKRDVFDNNGQVVADAVGLGTGLSTNTIALQNGNLGGVGIDRVTYDEIGLFGQWKF